MRGRVLVFCAPLLSAYIGFSIGFCAFKYRFQRLRVYRTAACKRAAAGYTMDASRVAFAPSVSPLVRLRGT